MTRLVREDPSQRSPNVRRAETRATQQASELFATHGAEQFLGRLQVDTDRHLVNGANGQVRAPQNPAQRPCAPGCWLSRTSNEACVDAHRARLGVARH